MALTDGLLIKVVNIIAFVLLLGGNIYSVAGPEDIYQHGRETYVTPSYYAFYTWSLIHLLLIGTMIYQFTDKGKKVIVDGLSWRFALLAVLNAVYLGLWARHYYIVSFVFSLLVSAAVSQLYYVVKTQHKGETLAEELFVHLPFSLWHGWSIVLVVLSLFEAFGKSTHSHAGIFTKVFVCLAFVFLESTSAAYAFASSEGDAAGAAVISYALFAIFIHQTKSKFIHYAALVAFILSLFAIVKSVYGSLNKNRSILHDEERAPLVGSS